MNNQRRKAIDEIQTRLDDLRGEAEELVSAIEAICDEEREAYDALPDAIRDGERGEAMSDAIDALENAIDSLEGFDFDDVAGSLDEAKG